MKTVRVRIPVAVDCEADWCVGSIDVGMTKKDSLNSCEEFAEMCCLEDHHVVWITAEVPLPEPSEVEGVVEKGGVE